MRLMLPAAVALATVSAVSAAAEPYVVDKSHAAITFTVDHLGFSTVHGMFLDFDAQVDFDPAAVEDTRVRFVIDPSSIETFWDKRDEHLKSADFFDVENHPEIIFESTVVKPTGGESAEITGNLTMKGVTNEVTFEAELNKLAQSPLTQKQVAGFTITGTLDRTTFDLGYFAPDVGAEIPIRIDLEMSPAG